MDLKNFSQQLRQYARQLDELRSRRMPVIAGRIAVDHFRNNFRRSGFVDNGLHSWTPARRLSQSSSGAAARYPTLLSSRNHLFRSIRSSPSNTSVSVSTDAPYAAIHNNGGTVQPAVTPKMRRYAWYRYYQALGSARPRGIRRRPPVGAGRGLPAGQRTAAAVTIPPEALRWRRLALTPKTRLKVRIPRRQFIGPSQELSQAIRQRFESEISKIIKF